MSGQQTINMQPLLRFLEHLPKSGDFELTLLKVHLLIEELFTVIISKAAKNPQYIPTAGLGFSQKLKMARAFSTLEAHEWIWGACKKLNEARNLLSHELDAQKIEDKAEEFIKVISTQADVHNLANEKFTSFHLASFILFSSLSGYAHYEPPPLRIKTILGSAFDD